MATRDARPRHERPVAGTSSASGKVVLLTGDALLIGRRLDEIQARTVGKDPLFGAHEVLHGDTADLGSISTALATLSLAGTRLVVLRGADRLREETQRGVLELLDHVPPGTWFVLVSESPDMRRALFAALAKRGATERLEPESAGQFVADTTRQLGLHLDRAAASAIAEQLGADPSRIVSELEKLKLRFGDQPVDLDRALETVGGERTIADFALVNALRARQIGKAIGILRQTRLHGERLELTVGVIAGQLRSLLRAAALLEKGVSESAASAAIGGYGGRYVVSAARNYRGRELARAIAQLAEVDIAAKTGRGDANAKLERLLLSLLGRERARAV